MGINAKSTIIETDNYVGSLYLSSDDSIFNNDKTFRLSDSQLTTNFTFEFDAKPTNETTIVPLGSWASTDNIHNFIIYESYSATEDIAGIGLTLGTNGAVAIAHSSGYYYALLIYEGDLSEVHRYRFTIKDNVPYLYIDGNLVATGITPINPVKTLRTYSYIGTGTYGGYYGYANNFVLYNTAR